MKCESKFKVGDQWFYSGNRSASWFYVASNADGSCQNGLLDRVPIELWPMLDEIARLHEICDRMAEASIR